MEVPNSSVTNPASVFKYSTSKNVRNAKYRFSLRSQPPMKNPTVTVAV
jgi:hypothetical protein